MGFIPFVTGMCHKITTKFFFYVPNKVDLFLFFSFIDRVISLLVTRRN